MLDKLPGIQSLETQQINTTVAQADTLPPLGFGTISFASEKLTPETLRNQLGLNPNSYDWYIDKIPGFDINNADSVAQLRQLVADTSTGETAMVFTERQSEFFNVLGSPPDDPLRTSTPHGRSMTVAETTQQVQSEYEAGEEYLRKGLGEFTSPEEEQNAVRYRMAAAELPQEEFDDQINAFFGNELRFSRQTLDNHETDDVTWTDLTNEERQTEEARINDNIRTILDPLTPPEYIEKFLNTIKENYPHLTGLPAIKEAEARLALANEDEAGYTQILNQIITGLDTANGIESRHAEAQVQTSGRILTSDESRASVSTTAFQSGSELLNRAGLSPYQAIQNTETQAAVYRDGIENGSATAKIVLAEEGIAVSHASIQTDLNKFTTDYSVQNNDAALLDAVAKGVSKYAQENQTTAFNNVLEASKSFTPEQAQSIQQTLVDQIAKAAPQNQAAMHETILKSASVPAQEQTTNRQAASEIRNYAPQAQGQALAASYESAVRTNDTETAQSLVNDIRFNRTAMEIIAQNPTLSKTFAQDLSSSLDRTALSTFDNKTQDYAVGGTKPNINKMTAAQFNEYVRNSSAGEIKSILQTMAASNPRQAVELAFASGYGDAFLSQVNVADLLGKVNGNIKNQLLTYLYTSNKVQDHNILLEYAEKSNQNDENLLLTNMVKSLNGELGREAERQEFTARA